MPQSIWITGLFFASGFIGKRLEERITGVDFIEKLCEVAQEKPLSIGFLGGRPGVAEQTAKCLLKKYPYLTIVFAGSEWDENRFTFKKNQGKGKNKNFSPLTSHHSLPIDILFVAYGVPKQEEWIYENLPKLPVKAAMGVGGSFDFLSGIVPRAPFIIRFAGFEWLFRLIVEPWRWKRQLSLIEFVILVFKERLA